MTMIARRRVLQLGAAGAGFGLGVPGLAVAGSRTNRIAPAAESDERLVRLSGDGLGLTPAQYGRLLTRLLDEKAMTPDSYSLGGIVEELETEFARSPTAPAASSSSRTATSTRTKATAHRR